MGCVYSFAGRTFESEERFKEFLENKKKLVKEQFQNFYNFAQIHDIEVTPGNFKLYADQRFNIKYETASSKPFTVQGTNLEAVKVGKKTLSFRTEQNARRYKKGDRLEVISKNKSTGVKLTVKNTFPFDNFSNLNRDRKDEFARKMGDYKNFDDMVESNSYLNPKSKASRLFPEFREFIFGNAPGVLIEYVVEQDTYEQIVEEAESGHPARKPYEKLLKSVMTELSTQIEALERGNLPDGTFKSERLKRLEEMFEQASFNEDVLVIAQQALEDLNHYKNTIEKVVKNPEGSTLQQIDKLMNFRRLVHSYSFLEEILKSKKDVMKELADDSNREELEERFKFITEAFNARGKILRIYSEEVTPLLAKQLVPYAAKRAVKQIKKELKELTEQHKKLQQKIASGKLSDKREKTIADTMAKDIKRVRIDLARAMANEDQIIESLSSVDRDIGFFQKYLSPASQSSDGILAMYSLLVKQYLEDSRQKTISEANDIQKVYDRYAQGKKGLSLKKMYENIVEEYKGNASYGNTVLAFVSKYDTEKFKEDRDAFISAINITKEKEIIRNEIAKLLKSKTQGPAVKAKIAKLKNALKDPSGKAIERMKLAEFMNKTHVKKSDEEIDKILAKIKKEKGEEAVKEYAEENMNLSAMLYHKVITEQEFKDRKGWGDPFYFNDLSTLTDNYIKPKWAAMYDENDNPINETGELHKALLEKYLSAQSLIPENRRQGNILPGIRRSTKERVTEGQSLLEGVMSSYEEVKDRLTGDSLQDEQEYGETYDIHGSVIPKVPTYFFNTLEPKDTSMDVVGSVLRYIDMAHTFEARNKGVNTGVFLVDKFKERSVGVQNSKGETMFNRVGQRIGLKVQQDKAKGSTLVQERLEKFLEMQVFGMQTVETKIGNFRVDKAVGLLMKHSSFSAFALYADTLSRVLMGASSNLFQQKIQQAIELAGDEEYGGKVFTRGITLFNTVYGKDLFVEDFGKDGDKSFIGQFVDMMDVMQGEFTDNFGKKISGSTARKLMTTDLFFVHRYYSEYAPQVGFFLGMADQTKIKDAEGNEISLLEAYELGPDNKLRIKPGVQWDKMKETRFRNRMHGMNKYLNGVYNSFDKSVLEQHVWGNMALFFRKYLYTSMRRRYASGYVDYEMDEYMRGFSRSFTRALYRDLVKYRTGLIPILKGETFTTKEKMEAIKTGVSFGIGLANMSLAAILRAIIDADDDDEDIVYQYLLYNALRMQAETWSFWNPQEMMRIMKSPTILTTYLERITKFTAQLFDPTAEYERAYGNKEKGDSKLWSRFVKMSVGSTEYSANPEEAVKHFENIFY